MRTRYLLVFALAVLLAGNLPRVHAQQDPPQGQNQAQPKDHSGMAGTDMGEMQHDATSAPQAAVTANQQMSDMHMEMGPHMRMTSMRPASAGDEKRAEDVLATLRPAIEKYKDYQVALNEGFKIFHPELPQDHYHFTNYTYALEAQFTFNPAHPTSLLYKKVGGGYELEGAMYTAPRQYTEDQLNERIPLSIARWHEHVNLCMPPKGAGITQANWREFGLRGSIATQDACETAGGRWSAIIFNWMVHVYPYETDPAKIWAH
ncbi:MAG: hypothetical protein WAK91_07395 [Candidatus Acidiferrales bacterium]|jgi:hypothetical protein